MMKTKQWYLHLIAVISLSLMALPLAGFSLGLERGGLPPRPTVVPTSTPGAVLDGAYIELHLSGTTVGPDGAWTVVQWVDGNGDWHDVDGWQGTVELDGTQSWFLGAENMGAGPFRWQIFTEEGGALLGTSDTFMLPSVSNQRLIVPVDLTSA